MRKRLLWVCIVIQLLFTPFSQLNHNTSSRFAAMGAFCSSGHFEISPYLSETDDWAKTPDGKSFSNKAPGTLFIAAPLYCAALAIQRALSPAVHGTAERVKQEWKLRFVLNFALSFLLQLLPWIAICFLWEKKLQSLGVDERGLLFAWIALLVGTTPAVLMDIWIGHPLVALFSLLSLWAIFEERAFLLGFALGAMQLTEYSSVLLVPGALVSWFWLAKERRSRAGSDLVRALAGAVLPGVLWVIYHRACFGSPWIIADRFQNPMFQGAPGGNYQLWGILSLPDPIVLAKLLFGWWRGILFSQPWVLVAFVLAPKLVRSAEAKRAMIYSTFGLVLLLLMNASFEGWHGGSAAGPRYLSAALPVFAIPVALGWKEISPFMKRVLWITLGFSCLVFFNAKVFSPTAGLWPEWIQAVSEKPWETAWKSLVELAIVWVGVFR